MQVLQKNDINLSKKSLDLAHFLFCQEQKFAQVLLLMGLLLTYTTITFTPMTQQIKNYNSKLCLYMLIDLWAVFGPGWQMMFCAYFHSIPKRRWHSQQSQILNLHKYYFFPVETFKSWCTLVREQPHPRGTSFLWFNYTTSPIHWALL